VAKSEVRNDHIWDFDDIGRRLSGATYQKTGQAPVEVKVAIADDKFTKHFRYVHPIAADLFDLAESVQLADWWSVPAFTKHGRPRNFSLTIPVRCPEIFDRPAVHDALSNLLHFQTRDLWSFKFVLRRGSGRPAEQKRSLFPDQFDEIALFSSGADSTAGAAGRLLDHPDKRLLLVSVDPDNHRLHNAQSGVSDMFEKRFPLTSWLPITFIRRRADGPKAVNRHFRSRGFSFLLAGAATSLVFDQNTLFIYEPGLGSLNLPFRASEIGVLGHARAVHPLSLLYASRLISTITGTPFHFENPFFYWTKADLLKLLVNADLSKIIHKTITCDRSRPGDPQCGCCSSCLYRRLGMLVSHIEDQTIYRTQYREEWKRLRKDSHFKHMSYQVARWQKMLDSENPWGLFARQYPTQLNDMVERVCRETGQDPHEMSTSILDLIERHVFQWRSAEPDLERMLGFYRS